MTTAITSFSGRNLFLSNFYPTKRLYYRGQLCATLEHGFQAAKTLDAVQRRQIMAAPTPAHAKKIGRRATKRDDWDDGYRLLVMERLIKRKFRDLELRRSLLETDDAKLVEGNYWHDQDYGNCVCGRPECEEEGDNLLGILLMAERERILRSIGGSYE